MSGFIDSQKAELPEIIRGTVCVIGAGAAGITLARKLAETEPGIILVEAGAFEIDGQTQALFIGRQLGLRYFDLASCRLRYFGGTTNHWSGYCRANDPIDYAGRPELGLPPWPFGPEELEPYIVDAGRSLGIEPDALDPARVIEAAGVPASQLADTASKILQTKIFQLAPEILMGRIWRDTIETSPNLTTYLNLNVTHVQLTPDATAVSHVEAATTTGRTCRIEARHFVLCCHAIENARLLLASNDVMPSGIGNTHDHVGRYFMDHTHILASRFIPSDSFPPLYDRGYAARHQLNANMSFTDDFLRREGLLNYYCRFEPEYVSGETEPVLRDVIWNFRKPGNLDYLADVAKVTSELGGAVRSELSRRGIRHFQPAAYRLNHRLEQAPNPESRVVLSDRRDALGNRIADLDWRLNDHDIESFSKGQAAVGRELAALGYGRIEEEEITRELVESRVQGHYHHIGTTRMSVAPKDGVVDANGTVHGIANLHIGGSSVFPTAGYSGPTMMIIAMALRQSEHLKSLMG